MVSDPTKDSHQFRSALAGQLKIRDEHFYSKSRNSDVVKIVVCQCLATSCVNLKHSQ